MTTPDTLEEVLAAIVPADPAAMAAAEEHQDRLTKPRGSLGALEEVGIRLAGVAGMDPPPVPDPAVVAVFAGDHGVVGAGVTPWPSEVTAQMVANFVAGGAAINVVARQVGARVVVVDIGVASELQEAPGLLVRKVRAGTADLSTEAAMTRDEALRAVLEGRRVAAELVAEGARALITGDMGIGNTTPSAALIAHFTGRPGPDITGRGTGIDDTTLARKVEVVQAGLDRAAAAGAGDDALAWLAQVGGLEIGGLAGFILGGAAARVPVLIDGVIACAALATAAALAPAVVDYCFAGHLSIEPGAKAVLDHLGLRPLLDLGLRLGEGSGATLALPLLQTAARLLGEMATFDSAGVTDKDA
jgi:nicotinate-nucleotide--dimethylbenzimidazole phosphoribosyltransferase